jgi:hypothetical protein
MFGFIVFFLFCKAVGVRSKSVSTVCTFIFVTYVNNARRGYSTIRYSSCFPYSRQRFSRYWDEMRVVRERGSCSKILRHERMTDINLLAVTARVPYPSLLYQPYSHLTACYLAIASTTPHHHRQLPRHLCHPRFRLLCLPLRPFGPQFRLPPLREILARRKNSSRPFNLPSPRV